MSSSLPTDCGVKTRRKRKRNWLQKAQMLGHAVKKKKAQNPCISYFQIALFFLLQGSNGIAIAKFRYTMFSLA